MLPDEDSPSITATAHGAGTGVARGGSEVTGGAILVLSAGVLWGTTGTTQAFAPVGATPATIGAMRLLIGGLVLMLLALARGGFGASRWPLVATFLAGAGVAAYQLSFFAAVSKTGVAVGTLIGIGSSPVIAGLLGFLFRGERLERNWWLATALAVAGCGLWPAGAGR